MMYRPYQMGSFLITRKNADRCYNNRKVSKTVLVCFYCKEMEVHQQPKTEQNMIKKKKVILGTGASKFKMPMVTETCEKQSDGSITTESW